MNLSINSLFFYLLDIKALQNDPLSDIQRQDLNYSRFLSFNLNNSPTAIHRSSSNQHILTSFEIHFKSLIGTV